MLLCDVFVYVFILLEEGAVREPVVKGKTVLLLFIYTHRGKGWTGVRRESVGGEDGVNIIYIYICGGRRRARAGRREKIVICDITHECMINVYM